VPEWIFALCNLQIVGGIIFLGCFSTALTGFGENYVLQTVSPEEHAVLLSTTPTWALLISVCVSGEQVDMQEVCGAALVVLGVIINVRGSPSTTPIEDSHKLHLKRGVQDDMESQSTFVSV